MDLISRKAAIDALEKEKPTPFVNKDGSIDPFGVGRQNQWYRDGIAIMNLPSAQPEVVRCKDCKWYDIAHPYGSVITDVFHCKINGRFFEASHFCGYGERRE